MTQKEATIYLRLHEETHRALFSRRKGDLLWGGPLENAWVGVTLQKHKVVDKPSLERIREYLTKWWGSVTPETPYELAAGSLSLELWVKTLSKGEKELRARQCRDGVLRRRDVRKGTASPAFLGSAAYLYAVARGLSTIGCMDDEIRQALREEIQNIDGQRGGRYNLTFLMPSLLLVEGNTDESRRKMRTWLSTLDPDELDEGSVIVLLWALTSMPEEVLAPEKTEPRVLVSDLGLLRQNIWSRFQALYTRLSFQETFEGESSASWTGWYYVPLIELALLDDCLSLFEEELLVFSRGNLESYVLHRAKIREIVNLALLLVVAIFGNVAAWNLDVVLPAALRAGLAFVDTEIALYLLARGIEVFDKRLPFLPTSQALLHGNLRALTKLVLAGAVVALLTWLTGG